MLRIIKLCMKQVKDKENKEFPSFFGYKVDKQEDGTFKTREYPTVAPDGSTVMKAKSFKIGLGDTLAARLKVDNNQFPYIVTYDDELVDSEGKKVNYIKVDKDKDKKVRLDKHGRRHPVLVLRDVVEFTPCPKTDINFDDIEDFE